jgi:DNA-binding LacI/PurR family transcriptional regulator
MLDGVDEVARTADHLVAVSDIRGPLLDPDTFGRFALEGRVDGALVAVSLIADELLARLAATGMALVPLNGRSAAIAGSVTMADREGGMLAVAALAALGHRRIGFVTGSAEADVARRREQGYRDGLAAEGIPFDPSWVAHGTFTTEGASPATRRLLRLARARRPTALVCLNLTMALGVVAAVRGRGERVPDDVSVVTFDDHPLEEHLAPPLSSIAMPMRAMGTVAAAMLFASLAGEPLRHVVVADAPRLVLRGSTGPPPRR